MTSQPEKPRSQERHPRPVARGMMLVSLPLVLICAASMLIYRGPRPISPKDDSPSRTSAVQMKQDLVELLGSPAIPHPAGTLAGEAFLRRLETKLTELGVEHRRISLNAAQELPSFQSIPERETLQTDAKLHNLWVTVPGREPDLQPLLIATHHDSCLFGPGAGDAGSAVVALLEHIRLLVRVPPRRTTHYLFTDGEEAGLLGAAVLAQTDPLPIPQPCFVLNFDARGTRGGVPMFETHPNNQPWVRKLIGDLAYPRMTSSLAVTVYRTLPNATDFNVWSGTLGWPGFNFATIGGAHHYHQPSDSPENLSLRTLQHFGDHVTSVHSAIDQLSAEDVAELSAQTRQADGENAVFFDLMGWVVISFSEPLQWLLVTLTTVFLIIGLGKHQVSISIRATASHAVHFLTAMIGAALIGHGIGWLLHATPWGGLRYTPLDYGVGIVTLLTSFGAVSLGLEWAYRKHGNPEWEGLRDVTWCVTALLGLAATLVVPGGAYLVVIPAFTYATVRLGSADARLASWAGWIAIIVLAGPLLGLLVQALGPWKQSLYAVLAGLLAMLAFTAWLPKASPQAAGSNRNG